ncbi:MAG: hypothetical protein OXF79_22775 [Chloroflexi bacterium]|nr:hypothetical protein [Chloroflexota bacterium]
MSEINQVQNEAEYDAALARISELLDAELNTAEGAELDRICTLVEIYEAEHYPIDDPDPSSMIEFLIDQAMVSRGHMEALVGGSDNLDAMMTGRTSITVEVARLMHERSGIPIEFFIKEPAEPASAAASD